MPKIVFIPMSPGQARRACSRLPKYGTVSSHVPEPSAAIRRFSGDIIPKTRPYVKQIAALGAILRPITVPECGRALLTSEAAGL
ncbi:MAG: hypothetical protein K5663_12260 [Clostridiales bacterium]|nr:hypothetical protein [Clostridiales bacterium]